MAQVERSLDVGGDKLRNTNLVLKDEVKFRPQLPWTLVEPNPKKSENGFSGR